MSEIELSADRVNEIVLDAMRKSAPLDAEMAGETAMRHIAANRRFESASGSRNIDLSSSISLLASIATLAQLSVQSYGYLRRGNPASTIEPSSLKTHVLNSLNEFGEEEKTGLDDETVDRVCMAVCQYIEKVGS